MRNNYYAISEEDEDLLDPWASDSNEEEEEDDDEMESDDLDIPWSDDDDY